MNPRYPVFVVSKSRANSCITMRHLDAIGVPYRVVVEAAQFDQYAAVLGPAKLLALPQSYQDSYITFDDLGDRKSKGPGAARNYAWDVAVQEGAAWHWVMDDNICGFMRINRNLKAPVADGTIFYAMEDFCLRYDNVAMAGPCYRTFVHHRDKRPPLTFNTRIYSCNLIRNDIPFRWECRYNEDTDLSIRILKAGWVTVQFYAFVQWKIETQTIRGGCKTDFYDKEGTGPKSRMLVRRHPDVARLAWRYGRLHHYCDYRQFKNRPRRRPDAVIPAGVNNYGMELVLQRQPRRPYSTLVALEQRRRARHEPIID